MNMETVKKGVQDLTASKKEAMCRNAQLKDELKKLKCQKTDMKQIHAELVCEVNKLKKELLKKKTEKEKHCEDLLEKDKCIQELDQNINSLNNNNRELEGCIEALKRNLDQYKEKVEGLESKICVIKKQIAENEAEIEDLREQCKDLKECETKLREEERNVSATLSEMCENTKKAEKELECANSNLAKSEEDKKKLECEIEELEVCLRDTEQKLTCEMNQYELLRRQNEQLQQELADIEATIIGDQKRLRQLECDLEKMKRDEEDEVQKLHTCIRAVPSGSCKRAASFPTFKSSSTCTATAARDNKGGANKEEYRFRTSESSASKKLCRSKSKRRQAHSFKPNVTKR